MRNGALQISGVFYGFLRLETDTGFHSYFYELKKKGYSYRFLRKNMIIPL